MSEQAKKIRGEFEKKQVEMHTEARFFSTEEAAKFRTIDYGTAHRQTVIMAPEKALKKGDMIARNEDAFEVLFASDLNDLGAQLVTIRKILPWHVRFRNFVRRLWKR